MTWKKLFHILSSFMNRNANALQIFRELLHLNITLTTEKSLVLLTTTECYFPSPVN